MTTEPAASADKNHAKMESYSTDLHGIISAFFFLSTQPPDLSEIYINPAL